MLKPSCFFSLAKLRFAAMITICVFIAAFIGIELTLRSGRIASIWLANAVVLVALLRTSPRTWAGWLLCGLVGNLAANLATGDSTGLAAILSLCNTVEIILVAGSYRWWAPVQADLTQIRSVFAFDVQALQF